MSAWKTVRWILLVLVVAAVAVVLARGFSGSEDTWIRGAGGRWVAHGHPAGPPPAADYEAPLIERLLPWGVLVLFALGGLIAALTSARARASRDELDHMVRTVGTASTLAWVAALCVMIVLCTKLMGGLGSAFEDTSLAVLAMAGLAAFMGLLGQQMYVVKKVVEAHYDLKRSLALLQDSVERLGAGGTKGGPPAA